MVMPFYHSGMGVIQPRGSTLPRAGHQLHITIGQPLPLGDITCRCGKSGEDQQQVCAGSCCRLPLQTLIQVGGSATSIRCLCRCSDTGERLEVTSRIDDNFECLQMCGYCMSVIFAVLQVWMDITTRVRAALADLEAQSPTNAPQLKPGAMRRNQQYGVDRAQDINRAHKLHYDRCEASV
jgi:hypothetical protein